MTLTRTLKMLCLTLIAAFAFAACGASETTTLVADTAATESEPAAPAEPTQPAVADAAAPAPVDTAEGPRRGLVTFGDEQFEFDMWQCGGFGDEAFFGSGVLLANPDSGTEVAINYELPALGDGENAEYDNTFRLIFGNDTWKAGTLTSSLGDEAWGTLDWTRDGENLTGTATMVHSWGEGSENSEPRVATFQIAC